MSALGALVEDRLSFIDTAHLHSVEAHLGVVAGGAALAHLGASESSDHRRLVLAAGGSGELGADGKLLVASVAASELHLIRAGRAAKDQLGIGQIKNAARVEKQCNDNKMSACEGTGNAQLLRACPSSTGPAIACARLGNPASWMREGVGRGQPATTIANCNGIVAVDVLSSSLPLLLLPLQTSGSRGRRVPKRAQPTSD